jgi:hypothetical protein
MNAEQELWTILRPTKHGTRACVPVFGSGINIQAAKIEGRREDDWSGLLSRIAEAIGVSEKRIESLPSSNLARWESMLRLWARTKNIEPYKAEAQLQKLACEHLRTCEQMAAAWQLYGELAGARFLDIISLNFDRRIALSSERTDFVNAPAKWREGPQGETLYRHDCISHPEGSCTRVWYPHGDTNKFATLKLGVRKYGFHLVTLEESRQGFGEEWRVKRGWNYSLGDPFANSGVATKPLPKWTNVFLTRNVVFIGCGLSLDEWSLWWIIRTRSLVARRGSQARQPQAFYVGVMTTSEGALRSLFKHHGIVTIEFKSYDDLWKAVRLAIS